MDVYLLDGTYELFRHFFALPSHIDAEGREVAATRGTIGSVLNMLESGVTHLGVATDHVIESFRNHVWQSYKSSAGVEPLILAQFPLLEEGIEALGVVLWPMVDLEADDALASAAALADASSAVDRVFICTPDKDLSQCVRDGRVLQLERRTGKVIDEAGVVAKFGVMPGSIADYLALVGDSADGFPGLPGWGARSAATVLGRYLKLEAIPANAADWDVTMRSADKLAQTLRECQADVMLFRDLATLRTEPPAFAAVDDLRWRGPRPEFEAFCQRIEQPGLWLRARSIASRLSPA